MILQTIHKRVSNLSFMAFLAMLMTFVTFESKARTIEVMSYSGEALFEGIFFAEGEVAERIPELNGLSAKNFVSTDKERQEIDAFRASVVEYVNANHPDYMDELRAAVATRSHIKIDRAITKGKSYVEAAINASSYDRDEKAENTVLSNLEERVNGEMSTEEIKAEIKAEVGTMSKALGAQACIAVVIALVLALIKLLVIPLVDPGGTLYHEAMVDSIANL